MTHRPMRRAERATSHAEALAVLDAAPFAIFATVDEDGAPYSVPLSFARRGDTLYVHATNAESLKAACFRRDARTCATAVADVQAFFEDGDFSTSYRSAIAFGRIREVTDEREFKHALVDLCMKYVPANKHDIGHAMQAEGPNTSVWALDIDELTGKANPGPRGFEAVGDETRASSEA